MDPKSVEAVVGTGILLLVAYCVWLFCKAVSFVYNVIFPPPPQIFGGGNNSWILESNDLINAFAPPHRQVIAIDTEMVGAGDRGQINMLARVSIVSQNNCLYDSYVAPVLPVTDYRTFVSCIRPKDLLGAKSFFNVQQQVRFIKNGCILVGHDIQKDLQALGLTHPDNYIRDTAMYRPFRMVLHEKNPDKCDSDSRPRVSYKDFPAFPKCFKLSSFSRALFPSKMYAVWCLLYWWNGILTIRLPLPDSPLDKLDLRIAGSIDLGSNWDVRDSLNKIGQSLRQDNREIVKTDNQNSRQVQYEGMSDIKLDNFGHGEGKWVSSVVRQPNDRTSDVRDKVPQREATSVDQDAIQNDKDLSDDRSEDGERDNVHWDSRDNEYFQRQRDETTDILDERGKLPRRKEKTDVGIVGYTQFEGMKTTDHKVKDVARTKEFSVHLFKQTMQVFDSIKRKVSDDDMKVKVDEMARSYKEQFGEFVRKQRETSVRTKMGDQRAILHTMDTSNLILQRLVNFLKADIEQADVGQPLDNTLQREVDTARDLEYKHVCSKYGYCRTDKGFTAMLQSCIKKIISVDDEKMYQARDAITEVLKTADYSKLIDSKTDKSFKKKITRLEKKEPEDLRDGLRVILGMLSNSQTPLMVEGENSEVVKKTAAFYTLLAMWEEAMPADESNKLEWTDIEKSLGDWANGTRTDIFDIVKALERNMKRGFKKIDPDTEVKMKEQVKIIRG